MIYMQCKCGESKFWGSGMSPNKCEPCKKCNSVPARGPGSHPDPIPHEFVAYPIESDQGGATLSRCKHCNKTKSQIEKGK